MFVGGNAIVAQFTVWPWHASFCYRFYNAVLLSRIVLSFEDIWLNPKRPRNEMANEEIFEPLLGSIDTD
jgi:hypothetical protein